MKEALLLSIDTSKDLKMGRPSKAFGRFGHINTLYRRLLLQLYQRTVNENSISESFVFGSEEEPDEFKAAKEDRSSSLVEMLMRKVHALNLSESHQASSEPLLKKAKSE